MKLAEELTCAELVENGHALFFFLLFAWSST